jgi:hypothetical protein
MTLDEARACIGRRVTYLTAEAAVNPLSSPPQPGVIISVGSRFVHVRYGSDTGTSATRATDLTLAGGEPA